VPAASRAHTVPLSFTLGLRIGMGAKVKVQLGLSTAVYRLPHPTTPDPGGPLDLSTVVHGSGLTWWPRCWRLGLEVKEMAEHAPKLLSIADAARVLAISRGQVYRLVSSGALRVVKLGPNASRIPLEDVERLAREGVPRAAIHLLRRRGGGVHERR
jgi:excisionase family DNA binding protein